MTSLSTFCLHSVDNIPYFPQVINNSVDGRVYAQVASGISKACRAVGFGIRNFYGLISFTSHMSLFRQVLAAVLVLSMTMAWCSTCMAEAMTSSCCSEPCTECACGFEAMPLDADDALVVVVPSPQTVDPVLAYRVVSTSSDIARRTSSGRAHGPDLAYPPSTSARLSQLSVYLI